MRQRSAATARSHHGGTWFDEGVATYGDDVWVFDPTDAAWHERTNLGGLLVWTPLVPTAESTVMLATSRLTGVYSPLDDLWQWFDGSE